MKEKLSKLRKAILELLKEDKNIQFYNKRGSNYDMITLDLRKNLKNRNSVIMCSFSQFLITI